ncbi:MAG: class I SAM-dependent methyltransferase [Candidatus Acidiferrales bacterium]
MSAAASTVRTSLEGEHKTPSPFDTVRAQGFSERRREFFDRFLPDLVSRHGLRTALDVGCGFGYFSGYLKGLGLQVTAVDGREENVNETAKRNPGVKCIVADVEGISPSEFGQFDLVFCVGLLYHLENPFRAVRNLKGLCGGIALLETVVAPVRGIATVLYEEPAVGNQGLNYIAAIPSESWLLKSLYRVGLPFVFRTRELPDHPDFRSGLIKKRMRTVLVGARYELQSPLLELVSEPTSTNPFLWDRSGFGHFLRNEGLRNTLKKIIPARLLGLPYGH